MTGRHRAERRPLRALMPAVLGVVLAVVLGVLAVATSVGVGVLVAGGAADGGPAGTPAVAGSTPVPSTPESATDAATDPVGSVPRVASRRVRAPVVVPEAGPGTFRVAPGGAPVSGGTGATTYTVEVERGLPFAPRAVAREVDRTLGDPRGWSADGDHALARVPRDGDLRVVLASPRTADRLCAPLLTRGRLSCRNGDTVVLNAWRWLHGADTYRGDRAGYRRYLVNHEVGHALGHAHVGCPAPGEPAPVMVQQTKGLEGCRRNPWPVP